MSFLRTVFVSIPLIGYPGLRHISLLKGECIRIDHQLERLLLRKVLTFALSAPTGGMVMFQQQF